MNLFVAILTRSFRKVKTEFSKKPNEVEFFNYFKSKIWNYIRNKHFKLTRFKGNDANNKLKRNLDKLMAMFSVVS